MSIMIRKSRADPRIPTSSKRKKLTTNGVATGPVMVSQDRSSYMDSNLVQNSVSDMDQGSDVLEMNAAHDSTRCHDDATEAWIEWFCSLYGNEYLVTVDDEFLMDDFNWTGLSCTVPFYEEALDMIQDVESPSDSERSSDKIQASAETLYGLIHQRYILTPRGLSLMAEKYKQAVFGYCPRVNCENIPVLPAGSSDAPSIGLMKLYCPNCEDLYHHPTGKLDGSFFGTTFPHLFFNTYPDLVEKKPIQCYEPKIFGFRLHKNACSASSRRSARFE